MPRLDVERKHTRADGRIKVLLRDPADRQATVTLLREPNDAAEFDEGGQVEPNGQGGWRRPVDPGPPDRPARVR